MRPDSAVGITGMTCDDWKIQPENCRVFHEKNHFDLLDDARMFTGR